MATNPYTSVAISGYRSNEPPDDGTVSSANEITWAKHVLKLAEPIKTLAEGINTNVLSMGGKLINTDADENNAMGGALAFTSSELTIAAGAITATRSHHTVDTQSDASSDDLDTIATGSVADFTTLLIRAESTARTVVCKHEAGGAGQLHNTGALDVVLEDNEHTVTYMRRGADWYQVGGGGFVSLVKFESSDTWTKKTGLKRVKVTVTGSGGGGAGGNGSTSQGHGSGAAGGTSIKILEASELGSTETVTIGAAGNAGNNGAGGTGGTTSFGALSSATGGDGGVVAGITTGVNGGIGIGGDINIQGQGGTTIQTGGSNFASGTGGSSFMGGGAPNVAQDVNGRVGGKFGGGGSGAYRDTAGGAGAPGIVIVEEFY